MHKKHRKINFSEKIEEFMPTALHEFFFDISKEYVQDKDILDIGCWTGGYLSFLQGYARYLCALDIEENAIAIAKKNLPEVDFVKASVLELPFQSQTFDTVTMWAVIEHIPVNTEVIALEEIRRVLRPKGVLCLNTMNDHPLSNLLDPALFLKGHRHYRVKTLEKFLNDTGFEILKVYKNGGIFTPLYLNLLYFFKYIVGRKMPRFQILEKWQRKDYRRKGFNELNIIARKV